MRTEAVFLNGVFRGVLEEVLRVQEHSAPLAGAWNLHSLWPRSELVVVNDAGHAASNPGITEELIRATGRFATR
jgi:hypothetical protein